MEMFPNPCQIQVVILQVKLSLNASITCAVYDVILSGYCLLLSLS